MKTATDFQELRSALAELERPVGFVPTMGFLHAGHLSLVKKAKTDNKSVVVSIFTNPTQFAPEEDLENYPTDLPRDLAMLEEEGVDLVWLPEKGDMYPDRFQTWVDVEVLTRHLEGQYRPSHFRGVTTVVAKLFNATQPDRAYFGQKDAQQAAVVQQMVRDLNYPIEIVICPTIRDKDGLAMSSRNSFLSDQERTAARCISKGLAAAALAYLAGERKADTLIDVVESVIQKEELAELQYISCADPLSLEELEGEVRECLISLAVYVGKTRLIDNILLHEEYRPDPQE